MENQESFKYKEITIFHENGVQYAKPTWDFASQLDTENATTLDYSKSFESFKRWSATQKFPILSRVLIPDGVYPTSLFTIKPDLKKQFGVDISHYAYIGNNNSSTEERFPTVTTDCPFDEELPAPKSESQRKLELVLQAKSFQLETVINNRISQMNSLESVYMIQNSQDATPKFMNN
ncbi:hypothetical protein [Daejeonella oryzae]|uniref:hypothetical protein n=1 Tax=Daejeonella oryzae TaxID=1122943 RepID=UPI0004254DCF|nr:hypothetical protein [Daejeonella oryzae]